MRMKLKILLTNYQMMMKYEKLDREIPTEEYLTEEQIINMKQADKEDQEMEESENDNDNEEIPSISIKKAADGLKTFISFLNNKMILNSMLMICIFLEKLTSC